MEQNQFNLDELRRQWSRAEASPPEGWVSEEVISRMVTHARGQMRQRGSVAFVLAALVLVGVTISHAPTHDVFTNQSGLDHDQVVLILDDAWEDINQDLTTL